MTPENDIERPIEVDPGTRQIAVRKDPRRDGGWSRRTYDNQTQAQRAAKMFAPIAIDDTASRADMLGIPAEQPTREWAPVKPKHVNEKPRNGFHGWALQCDRCGEISTMGNTMASLDRWRLQECVACVCGGRAMPAKICIVSAA